MHFEYTRAFHVTYGNDTLEHLILKLHFPFETNHKLRH